MTNKRRYLEICGIIAFCVVTICVLSLSGRSRVTFAAAPKFQYISEPRDIYRFWQDNKIYGRILFYFGRGLPIDRTDQHAALFTPAEFRNDLASSALCNEICDDGYATPINASQYCGDFLNTTVLCDRYFAERWLGKNKVVLPKKISRMIEMSRGYKKDYSLLQAEQKTVINTLNRRLLEITYPELCPKGGEFVFTGNNYVFAGVKSNMFRKIYHIVPDRYWPEDRNKYAGYSGAKVSPDSIRSYFHVPILTLTMRALRPLEEEVIMVIVEEDWSREELNELMRLVNNKTFKSDLVVFN